MNVGHLGNSIQSIEQSYFDVRHVGGEKGVSRCLGHLAVTRGRGVSLRSAGMVFHVNVFAKSNISSSGYHLSFRDLCNSTACSVNRSKDEVSVASFSTTEAPSVTSHSQISISHHWHCLARHKL